MSGQRALPPLQTLIAVAILVVTYFVRIAGETTPGVELRWYLYVVTDAFLPAIAGASLFVPFMFWLISLITDSPTHD